MLTISLLFLASGITSFICSGFETGFVSWNRMKITALSNQGDRVARLAEILLRHREKVLSTVLVGNNLALVGMASAFAILVAELVPFKVNSIVESWVLTGIVFTFCELFPKSLYRIYAFRLTYRTVPLMFCAYILFYPISTVFLFFARLISRNNETTEEDVQMREVALEGVRQNLLPYAVPLLVSNLQKSALTMEHAIKELPIYAKQGEKDLTVDKETRICNLIENASLFQYDTITCLFDTKSVHFTTEELLDFFFRVHKN